MRGLLFGLSVIGNEVAKEKRMFEQYFLDKIEGMFKYFEVEVEGEVEMKVWQHKLYDIKEEVKNNLREADERVMELEGVIEEREEEIRRLREDLEEVVEENSRLQEKVDRLEVEDWEREVGERSEQEGEKESCGDE